MKKAVGWCLVIEERVNGKGGMTFVPVDRFVMVKNGMRSTPGDKQTNKSSSNI